MGNGFQQMPQNYCRNPGGHLSRPWCFSTNPSRFWEFCDVKMCTECKWDIASDCQCGIAQRRARIIGGIETEVNEYPWQAAVLYTRQFVCGGSLTNDRWVLSAAHCFDDKDSSPKNWEVILGDHDITSNSEADHLEFKISRINVHPNYKRKTANFGFALLKLKKIVNFARYPHIRPICLPSNDENTYQGRIATATGWGWTSNNGQISEKLQEVDLNVLSNEDCVDNYKWSSSHFSDQMMCANVPAGDKATCRGDSGGPLISRGLQEKNFELIGVSSHGGIYGCAHKDWPKVFARVTKQLDWISETTKKGSSTCPR